MSATRSFPSRQTDGNGDRPTLKRRLTQIVDELVIQGVPLAQARQEFERQFILASIRCHDGNLGRSARSMGVHRNTLRNKVSNLGIDVAEQLGSPRPPRRSLRRQSDPT